MTQTHTLLTPNPKTPQPPNRSCPSFAGILSLITDMRLNAGLPPLGFVAPRIYQVAAEHPGEINVLPGDAFFYPMWSAPQLKRLYEADDGYDFKNNYAVHLWAAAAEAVPAFRDLLRSLTVRDVFTCGGSFCRVARQLLADAHAARALCPAAEAEVGAMMAPGSPSRRDWRGGAL